MLDFNRTELNKILLILSAIIIIFGIAFRFYHQFIDWSFNGDEVNLGLDIINHNFRDLFNPFQSRQSAPPLFLLLEKITSEVAKPYISLKIICFLSSCASIFLFNRILKISFNQTIQIILLALFCFNPFILSNSLTLKQYSIDLMMGLLAVNYFFDTRNSYITFLFFVVFCLVSNVGLFFSASFSIFLIVKYTFNGRGGGLLNWKKLKPIIPYLLAPIPYLIFFVWFINQPGADNMKNYMVHYWNGSFIPLDLSIFKWVALQGKVIYVFFFSTYWFIGFSMLVFFLFSIYVVVLKKSQIFQKSIYGIISIYIITVFIHLLLSALEMYPFSDRLFLYLAPGIYLIIGVGIEQINRQILISWNPRLIQFISLIIPISAIMLYFTYLPGKANDVYALLEYVNSMDNTVVYTPTAKQRTLKWLEFTKYHDKDYSKLFKAKENGYNNSGTGDLLITVQSEKFGHTIKYSTPEPEIVQLLAQDKIVLYHRIEGYAIYKFK